ncbi:MAG TPA: thioredoxin domain-containing protein [Actinomycetales bacterium]|nr:thioredoxin domain-containing protein [Actinomycetales bacterium]
MSASRNERREAARKRAEQLRAETARRERRARLITIISTVAGLTVLAVLIMVIVAQGSKTPIDAVEHQPRNVVDGAIQFGDVDNKGVEAVVYSDYMCPICNSFEQLNGADLKELQETEGVVVSYYPVSFLDRFAQGTKFSSRSANAAMCVADGAKDSFIDFHDGMYENQPEENSPGLSNEQIAEIAAEAGAPDSVQQCILEEEFVEYVDAITQHASAEHEVSGTPTVRINGKDLKDDLGLSWAEPGVVKQAILDELN